VEAQWGIYIEASRRIAKRQTDCRDNMMAMIFLAGADKETRWVDSGFEQLIAAEEDSTEVR
jgi:hypothetical protein